MSKCYRQVRSRIRFRDMMRFNIGARLGTGLEFV